MIRRFLLGMLVVMMAMAAIAMLSFLLMNGQQATAAPAGRPKPATENEVASGSVQGATTQPVLRFQRGDVFAAGGRYVEWYHSDGTFVGSLDTEQPGGHSAGMAFDAGGNLYVAGLGTYTVTKFDISGTLLGTFGSGYSSRPESIVFDCGGNAYVGTVHGSDNDILKFDAKGDLLERFDVERERQGSDWIDLAYDQCTMFYTSEGRRIMRYDVCTDTQLTDFALLPGTRLWELRILPDSDLLVAATGAIYRLDSTGTVVMTYTHPTENNWRNLGLAPDGRSFWASIWDGNVYAFDIATGVVLTPSINRGSRILRGLAVFGEPTAATSRCCVDLVDKRVVGLDRDPVAPNYTTFTISITNAGLITIDVLPLLDQYDPRYLAFKDGTPYPGDNSNDGFLIWSDLTGPASYGFSRNLPPGEVFLVTTVFTVVRDIAMTTNTAAITGAMDIYGNLADEVEDDVTIVDVPTAIELLYFRAVAEEEAVRLEWATAAELGTIGFYVYRAPDDNFGDAQAIVYAPATGCGSTYSYVDRHVTPDHVYWYWLIEVGPDGLEPPYGPVWGGIGPHAFPHRLYLPLVQKGWERQGARTPR